jgi:hypothetical protein
MNLQDLTAAIEIGLFIGSVLIAFYTGKSQKKSATLEDFDRTIGLMRERITALEESLAETKKTAAAEHDKVIALETQLKLKDETIKQYLDILQNRDPALAEYMKSSSKALESLVAGVSELLKVERTVTVTTK